MAKPQLEDGYTQVANEILEQLAKMPLSPNQWRVLLCIIRKTYGFHKKVDYIANFQIAEATGLHKSTVSRCLHGLNDMHLITRKGKYIGFQKDWELWVKLSELPTFECEKTDQRERKLAEPSTNEKLTNPSSQLTEPSTKVDGCASAQKIKNNITKNNISSIPQPLIDFITTYTLELHDDPGNIEANITRASRIMNTSSLMLDDFIKLMGEAKRKAWQNIAHIEKVATKPAHFGPEQDIPQKNLMPYFFACLKQLVDRAEKAGPRGSP